MNNKLKDITYTTKKHFKSQDIVLPADYSKIFEINAKNKGIDFENQDVILSGLHYDEKKLDTIIAATNSNLNLLETTAKSAKTAIINKDDKALDSLQQDMSTMQEQIAFLQKELFTDALTKAKNRKWFNDFYLTDNKFTDDGCLVFIDLNNFKNINDSYGHIVGDQVLKYLATFLKNELAFDWVHIIRYAGDEFVIVFDKKFEDPQPLEVKMEAIQSKLLLQKLKSKTINNLSFGFSYGLTIFNKNDDFDEVIEVADEKMYQNKLQIKANNNSSK